MSAHNDSAAQGFREGDRCIVCRHWWWNDGKWHSLVPKSYVGREGEGRDVICTQDACQQVTGAPETAASNGLLHDGSAAPDRRYTWARIALYTVAGMFGYSEFRIVAAFAAVFILATFLRDMGWLRA